MADNPRLSRVYGAFQVCADPSDPSKTTGLILPQLTTAQAQALVNKIPSVIQDGYVYYDTDQKGIYAYINGGWQELYTAAQPAGGLRLPNEAATIEGTGINQVPGFVYYNTTTPNNVRTYVGDAGVGAFGTIPAASLPVEAGAGLIVGNSPFALPTGPSSTVEAVANQYNGFIYYNSGPTVANVNTVRGRIGGAWSTIYTTTNTATGVGLPAGNSILALPSASYIGVEAIGNQQNGFIYYNSGTGKSIRGYINGAWSTIYSTSSAATGAGLTNGTILSLPSGPNTLETGGANAINGFIYYDATTNTARGYLNGVWSPILNAAVKNINANYTLLDSDVILQVDTTVSAKTITLSIPSGTFVEGKIFTIKDNHGNASVRNITITAPNPYSIDGGGSGGSITINTNYGSKRLYTDGTDWYTV